MPPYFDFPVVKGSFTNAQVPGYVLNRNAPFLLFKG